MSPAGQLVVVGCGIQLGRHISSRALSEIQRADQVFILADDFAQAWLKALRPDLISLSSLYARDRDRRETYSDMESALLTAVRSCRRVCAVFYGHPGVFAQVPHAAIRQARAEGFAARMEPGISTEACLYADLGIDPADAGVQSCETTRFLISDWPPNPAALLILWQVALAGKLDCIGFDPEPERLRVLVDKLRRWYPADCPVILYEAAQLPIERFRAERLTLSDLPEARYKEYTTLVIPAVESLAADDKVLARLRKIRSRAQNPV